MSDEQKAAALQECIDCNIRQICAVERCLQLAIDEREIRDLNKSLIELKVHRHHLISGDYKHIDKQKSINRNRKYDAFGHRR